MSGRERFGCGAGRMIRHLTDLAATREVWGADISAEHTHWCKQNLRSPFNFAKMLRPSFDVLSITREACFYQTAFLLKGK